MKYRLTVNERQLVIIKVALEEFFRLPLNQWWELADRLCMKGLDLSADNPKHKDVFHDYILTRDAVREIFQSAGRVMWPHGTPQKDEEQMVAEDLWAVIRHQLWKDSKNRNEWDVAGGPVYIWGPEPQAEIQKGAFTVDLKFDAATKAWFEKRPGAETTVCQCDCCRLFYKPELGHKCKAKRGAK